MKNKKNLLTFFAFIALAQFCFVMPIKRILFGCFLGIKKKTTIKDLPNDCLYIIFEFFGGKTFLLRSVNKDFKSVIDPYPRFFTYKDDHIYSPLEIDFCVRLHNEKMVDKMFNTSFFSEMCKKNFSIRMLLDEKESTQFLASRFEELFSHLETKKNKIKVLKINYHHFFSTRLAERKSIEIIKNCEKSGEFVRMMKICNKDNIGAKELSIFKNIQKLEIKNCKDFGKTRVVWPKGIKFLTITQCENFNYECLKGLTELEKLELLFQSKLQGDELKKVPKSLEELRVAYCMKFGGGQGLGLLKNLQKLAIINYGKFELKSLAGLKNLHKLTIHKCPPDPSGILKDLRMNGCEVITT